jgi:phosphoglycolate phosphatase|tara:strand:+ start:140 stop:796 length:657 start_codon:yes stop_codon:yes gene_type:complete
MKTRFELIIFDWDGTLSDSVGLITDLMIQSFLLHNVSPPSRMEVADILGIKLSEAFKILLKEKDQNASELIFNSYIELYNQSSNKVKLFDGVELGIKELHRYGYKIAIATGGGRNYLDSCLAQTSIKDFINVTKTSDDCFSKPHPQMCNEILNELIIEPEKSIVIGDSIHDLQMAKNAGISSLAVTYGAHKQDSLSVYDALDYMDDANMVFDWIRRHG